MRANQRISCSRHRLLAAAVLAVMIFLTAGGTTVYAAKKPKLNKTTVYMLKGKTVSLKVKNTKKKITWKSSKPTVVSVTKKGKLKAKKNGEAIISAKIKGGKTLKCTVYVGKYQWIRGRVLASEKSENGWKYLEIKNEINDEGGEEEIRIYAKRGKQALRFEYYINHVEPAEGRCASMTMSSETALKTKGSGASWSYGTEWKASYVMKKKSFDGIDPAEGTPKGMTFSDFLSNEEYYGDPDEGEEIWEKRRNREIEGMVVKNIDISFGEWNGMMKKYKVTMKDLGFTGWKD